jgi:hypothetical protein
LLHLLYGLLIIKVQAQFLLKAVTAAAKTEDTHTLRVSTDMAQ